MRNHKDDIAAMGLFTVPTASLRLLHGFFVIEHGRRHIVHFNGRCCTALAESKIRLLCWLRYVRP